MSLGFSAIINQPLKRTSDNTDFLDMLIMAIEMELFSAIIIQDIMNTDIIGMENGIKR